MIEGSTVDLVCEATAGDLPISYSWTGPSGQDVSLSDTDGTISVTISASGDYGTYTCAATNEIGMGNAADVEVVQAGNYYAYMEAEALDSLQLVLAFQGQFLIRVLFM